jgi:hypothetical protein
MKKILLIITVALFLGNTQIYAKPEFKVEVEQ